jgi:hypothetical protein
MPLLLLLLLLLGGDMVFEISNKANRYHRAKGADGLNHTPFLPSNRVLMINK